MEKSDTAIREKTLAPEDFIGHAVLNAWADVLGMDPGSIDPGVSFWDLGGTSFKSLQMFTILEKQFPVTIDEVALVKHNSVLALSDYIKQNL
ncbi:MAG: acyl carrier protein [Desulfobacter sp.]